MILAKCPAGHGLELISKHEQEFCKAIEGQMRITVIIFCKGCGFSYKVIIGKGRAHWQVEEGGLVEMAGA